MHKSIATIDSPEFINLQPLEINPLMSRCEIKVMYLGENRNRSFINEEVALEMAKSLRGAPIVGYFKTEKEDFIDHGNRMIIDDEGIKFECITKPYGFVDPSAKVWFQTFEDTDDFGNVSIKKYLMTTGYLWTGQFEECQLVTKEGRPQSMELDDKTLKGHWETNKENGMDFFIINDAIFSKLCILGEDVEPCFEGSSVTAPQISSTFTKIDDEFKRTLFSMMQELKFALQGGQQQMEEEKIDIPEAEKNEDLVSEETSIEESSFDLETENKEESLESVQELEEKDFTATQTESQSNEELTEKEVKEEASEDVNTTNEYSTTQEIECEKNEEEFIQEENVQENSDALVQTEYALLQEKYSKLEKEYNELVAFKLQVEDAQKDEMISKFCFLSDEDKKEVIENKSKYSLDEIEAKLSVICVRNRVNFDLDDSSKNNINIEEEQSEITTFNLSNTESSIPAFITAVLNNRNTK